MTYHCRLLTYHEWVCLEHTGYPRTKAITWWAKRAPGNPVPTTVTEALGLVDFLPQPDAICVRPAGKYFASSTLDSDVLRSLQSPHQPAPPLALAGPTLKRTLGAGVRRPVPFLPSHKERSCWTRTDTSWP